MDPVVDTHVHFFDLQDPRLRYTWLDPANPHPILTPDEVRTIASRNYRLNDFAEEARAAGVTKAVHVQAAVGIDDPVEETRWLEGEATAAGFPLAIVGHADLAAPDVEAVLDRHQEASPRFRGIRDFGTGGEYLTDDRWIAGVRALGRRGLVLSLDCTWARMPLARALADAVPDTLIVLDHMGLPLDHGPNTFAAWTPAMRGLAGADNVVCKISEFTMVEHAWRPDVVRSWIDACIEAFGPARCMVGTNWPVDALYTRYDWAIGLLRECVARLSHAERAAILAGNAERLYRL